MAEQVTLDGQFASNPWPLEVARSLLSDPSPWGTWWPGHPQEHQPNRHTDFNQLALQVTAYTRHPPGVAWHSPLHDERFEQTAANYSTQELLDGLFVAARGDRFNYGLICRLEPRLRLILQEIVQRIQSADPPHFEVAFPQNGRI